MRTQLSLEIMLSMAFAIILAGICASLYANAGRVATGVEASSMQYANMSEYYSAQMLYYCPCSYR